MTPRPVSVRPTSPPRVQIYTHIRDSKLHSVMHTRNRVCTPEQTGQSFNVTLLVRSAVYSPGVMLSPWSPVSTLWRARTQHDPRCVHSTTHQKGHIERLASLSWVADASATVGVLCNLQGGGLTAKSPWIRSSSWQNRSWQNVNKWKGAAWPQKKEELPKNYTHITFERTLCILYRKQTKGVTTQKRFTGPQQKEAAWEHHYDSITCGKTTES